MRYKTPIQASPTPPPARVPQRPEHHNHQPSPSYPQQPFIPTPNIQLKSAVQPVEYNYYEYYYPFDDTQEQKSKKIENDKKQGDITMLGKVKNLKSEIKV